MKSRIWIAIAVAFVLAVPSMAVAQVPAEVPVQGFLTDDQGVPIDGSVSVEFTIYDAATSGTEMHTQTETVDADAGAFSVHLTPPLTVFENNTDLYLGLAVDGGAEMSPLLKMGSVPYAAVAGNAQNAVTLEGKSASDFAPSSYTPAWGDLTGIPADLADGDDDTDTDTTYTASDGVSIDASNNITLNSNCASGEVLKWSGSAWDCKPDEDADTTYTAGSGLALNGTEFSAQGIDNSHIASNAAIDTSKIDFGTTSRTTLIAASRFIDTQQSFNDDQWLYSTYRNFGYPNDGGTNTATGTALTAPIEGLPEGAAITSFFCYYKDLDSSGEITALNVDLRSARMTTGETSDGGVEASASLSSSTGNNNALASLENVYSNTINVTITDPYVYWFRIKFDTNIASGDLRFYGCKVNWEHTGPF
jgi:hypothetical protein